MSILFGGELSAEAQAVLARLPTSFGEKEGRRFLLHPLPLFNNSVGVHDLGLMSGALNPLEILDAAGSDVRALYVAGSFLPAHLEGREDALSKLDLLVVQELFLDRDDAGTRTSSSPPPRSPRWTGRSRTTADSSSACVSPSRPSTSRSPTGSSLRSSRRRWAHDLGFQMSSSNIFLEIARDVPAYEGLRYPLLKDETKPVQIKHALVAGGDGAALVGQLA